MVYHVKCHGEVNRHGERAWGRKEWLKPQDILCREGGNDGSNTGQVKEGVNSFTNKEIVPGQ